MILPSLADSCCSLTDQFKRKFTRRNDLTSEKRLAIANTVLVAQSFGEWGVITALARQYEVSRTFVYSLASTLKDAAPMLFGEMTKGPPFPSIRELSLQVMLSLRLEGRSSLGAISTMMERFGLTLSSTGSISQILSHIGALLPMTLSTEDDLIRYLVFASDEIFSKTIPILVTVDPVSSVILRIELADSRKAEAWKKHFECLYDTGWAAIYLVSDEGTGLCAGHAQTASLSDVIRQSDTYHAIAHQLGQWVNRLEAAAYQAIAAEAEGERKLDSAKSDRVQEKRLEACEQATEAAEKAIALYEDFSYLYRCILQELHLFDADGNLRNRQQAEEHIESGLALIEDLGHKTITQVVAKIRRVLPNLLHYLDIAEKIVDECKALCTDAEALKVLCLAWQWGKSVGKAKKTDRKKRAAEQERFCLEMAESLLQEEHSGIREKVYSKLDEIVQSSALVECINSIIRPYLNTTKNHVTQEQLNLIMFYHNHRRYRDGKRKDETPVEILTGQEQDKDWIALVFDLIREKDPDLLLAS